MDALHFSHQVLVHVQATGRVHQQHIGNGTTRRIQGPFHDGHGIVRRLTGHEAGAYLASHGFQLGDGGRTVHVHTDHHDLLLLTLDEPASELARRGGLARALQAGQQNHHRRLRPQVQGLIVAAHDLHQLVVDDLDQCLARLEAARHLLAHGTLAHVLNEALDHRQSHVGFQQGHAHAAQGVLDVVFRQAALAAQAVEGGSQSVAEVVEHGVGASQGNSAKPRSLL